MSKYLPGDHILFRDSEVENATPIPGTVLAVFHGEAHRNSLEYEVALASGDTVIAWPNELVDGL